MAAQSQTDILIVGGGIIGVSIAYHLALRGVTGITLVERACLGMGTTGSSVASIEPLALFASVAALQAHSIGVFKNFAEQVGGDCGFKSYPLALFFGTDDLPALRQAVPRARAAGSDAAELTPAAFASQYPDTDLTGVGGVYFSRDAGFADPILTLNSYAEVARQLGVVIRQGVTVTDVRVTAGRVVGVETLDGPIHAGTVVLAPGLWAEALLRPLGLTAGLHLHRHFVVCIEAPPTAPPLSIIDGLLNFYTRPETSGGLYLLGGPGEYPPCTDPDENPPRVTVDTAFIYLEKLATRFPAMETTRLRMNTAYTGVADMSPDKQPLVGALPFEGLYFAGGMSGVGFKIAPGIGWALAGMMTGETAAHDLLAPLTPMRVMNGSLLIPDHPVDLIA